MCPAFVTCPLEHFPHIFHGDLHQKRKVWFWGILLLARNFRPRTFLGIFWFIGIFYFLVIFWPIITSASSPGSPVVEEIGNISWCFQSGSGYAAFFQHVNGLDFLSSSFFSDSYSVLPSWNRHFSHLMLRSTFILPLPIYKTFWLSPLHSLWGRTKKGCFA